MTETHSVIGVLLAGGQARRMGGGDKCLRTLGGQAILDHVIGRAQGQVTALVLNANGDARRFARFGLPVAPDVIGGLKGPLAGVLTGMEWARDNHPDCPWIATFATDAPFFPRDLVARMVDHARDADMVCARSAGRSHPVFGLWPVRLASDLRHAMADEDIRKVDIWTARYRLAEVEYPATPFDPFFNANTPEDLKRAEHYLAELIAPEGAAMAGKTTAGGAGAP